jgi:hypothetical protein
MRIRTSSGTSTDVSLTRNFEEIYGHAKARGLRRINSIVDLFAEEPIREFAWSLFVEHGCTRTSIVGRIGSMVNALQLSPRFRRFEFKQVYTVLREFKIEDPEELRSRRRTKEVGYDLLSSMLEQMRTERRALKRPSSYELALRIQDELLILWLTTFPWFARCLREARLFGPRPNIFKAPAPTMDSSSIPRWAMSKLRRNRRTTFWQFRFASAETPNGKGVSGFLPRRLIGLMEDYLKVHRKHLVGNADPGTLFLNRNGGMMSGSALMQRVGIITERYLQKKITPEAMRAIFAYHWLDAHPGDYERLAGILWMEIPSAKRRFDSAYKSRLPHHQQSSSHRSSQSNRKLLPRRRGSVAG